MLKLRSQSFRRYRIVGRLPSIYSDEFAKRLTERKFEPLGAEEERAHGWVTADNLLLTNFDVDTMVRGEQACFALRVDRRRVNSRLLRAHIDLEVRARCKAAEDDGRPPKIGRDERREIREALSKELLRNTPPSIDAIPMLIDPKQKICCVLSLNAMARELVPLHFQDSFDAHLVPLTPWTRGQELLQDDLVLRAGLDDLYRSNFGPDGSADTSMPSQRVSAERVSTEREGGMGRDEAASRDGVSAMPDGRAKDQVTKELA